MTTTRVVAAVVVREGRLLLGRRPREKRHGGLWEFPGGKLDEGESPADAARRELAEELGLSVTRTGDRLHAVRDDDSPFVIEFHSVETSGEPQPIEHSEIGWFTLAESARLELAPADAAFVRWYARQESVRR